MRLLSWNLFGLSEEHRDVRTEAAMFIALLGGMPEVVFNSGKNPNLPEVLMFQEVVPRTFQAHLRPPLLAAGYSIVPAQPCTQRGYFEVMAFRQPLQVQRSEIHSLDSQQGRTLLCAVTTIDGQDWLWITGHLESLSAGASLRCAQARGVQDLMRAHKGPAVFAGDTNLRVAETQHQPGIVDAWQVCGARRTDRRTWRSARGRRGARYDQIWGHQVGFRNFCCVGRDAVTPDGKPASDHLGISALVFPS